LKVTDAQAFMTARYVAPRHAVRPGGSAGGVAYQALHRAEVAASGSTMVPVCDRGEKHLGTVINNDWLRERNRLDPGIERELDALVGQMRAPACCAELQ
jgi:cystathionine beta-synthase